MKYNCEKCLFTYAIADCDKHGCIRRDDMAKKIRTNADKIRAMTDEELAEIIMCPYDTEPDLCNRRNDCLSCCLEWLQATAKRGDDYAD